MQRVHPESTERLNKWTKDSYFTNELIISGHAPSAPFLAYIIRLAVPTDCFVSKAVSNYRHFPPQKQQQQQNDILLFYFLKNDQI